MNHAAEIAKLTGADETTVTMMAKMAADFLVNAYGSSEEAAKQIMADQSNVDAGLMHAQETIKKLSMRALKNPEQFAGIVSRVA